MGPEIKETSSAIQVVRALDSWWRLCQNGWDLKEMTAEQVADAIGDKVAEMSAQVGLVDPNPDNDDTEQDQ